MKDSVCAVTRNRSLRRLLCFLHRYTYACPIRELLGLLVAGIGVPRNSDARIVGQHALDSFRHQIGAVRNGHLTGMLRVADPNASAVVDRYPTGATGGV